MRIPTSFTHDDDPRVKLAHRISLLLLLILVVPLYGRLSNRDSATRVPLSFANGAGEGHGIPSRRLTIDVKSDGQVLFGEIPVTESGLRNQLQKTQSAEGHIEVYIRSSPSVPYRCIEPILVICADMGLSKVTFGVNAHKE